MICRLSLIALTILLITAAPGATQPTLGLASVTRAQTARVETLSVDDAVAMALEANLGIQIRRVDPLVGDLEIAEARSVWVPTLTASITRDNQTSPAASFLAGGETEIVDRLFDNAVRLDQQVPWGGGRYTVAWDGSRSTTTNFFTSFDPILRANTRFTYTQPLLRNFGIDPARYRLLTAEINRDLSNVEVRRTLATTIRGVRLAYWDLVFAISSLEVQRQSLALAEESLRNNRIRVEVGSMAPIDIVEAEAEVARNEESVIIAEARIAAAEDALRTLVLAPTRPDYWEMAFRPTDPPALVTQQIDVALAVRTALTQRTDLEQLRTEIEGTDIDLRYYTNQRLPDIDVTVDYALTGLGGTRLLRGDGFPGPIIGEEDRSFGDVVGDLFSNRFPTWTVGVSIGYPLGRSSDEANLARARLRRTQSELRLREAEVAITAEVRDVGRQVTMNLQRVEATRVARELAERRLEAEERKFGVGLSTSFLVFQAQRDLADARNNELLATVDTLRSLVDFEAVQEVPLEGRGALTAPAAGALPPAAPATPAQPALGSGTTRTIGFP